MKKPAIFSVILAFLGVTGLVIGVTVYFADNYLTSKLANSEQTVCSAQQITHRVIIENDQMNPRRLEAAFCDRLIITNKDNKIRSVAFGEHDKHVTYDGISEAILAGGESLKIDLNQVGNFKFHDHYQQSVTATFLVIE